MARSSLTVVLSTLKEPLRIVRLPGIWASNHRRIYSALIVALLVAQLAAVYSRLSSSEEVPPSRALDEFRRRQEAAKNLPDPTSLVEVSSAPTVAASGLPGANSLSSAGGGGSPTSSCEWVCQGPLTAPKEGVYEWYQCGRDLGQCSGAETEPAGSEELGGVGREFPRKGQRSVIVTAANKWTSAHQYSGEHKEEFDLFVESSGVMGDRYDVDITIGPGSGGIHIKQVPPARYMQFPAAVGADWSGRWEDANREADADYAARIIDRQEIVISGRKVRTWVVELKMKLSGPKSTGDVLVRLWVSPEQRQTVQEFYDQSVTDDRGFTYKAKWMITLSVLDPKR